MIDMEQETSRFVQKIKESDIYLRYLCARKKLEEYPELKERIDEYRKNMYRVQNTEDGDKLYDEVEMLEEQGASLRENPLANEFLAAELAFCRMMQGVYRQITAEMDFDMTLGG